jgi:hypothetical protein
VPTFSTELSRYRLELINDTGSSTRRVLQGESSFSANVDFKNAKATPELIIVNAPTKLADDRAPAKRDPFQPPLIPKKESSRHLTQVTALKKKAALPPHQIAPSTPESGVISPITADSFIKLSNAEKDAFCAANWKPTGSAASGGDEVRAHPQLLEVAKVKEDWGGGNKSAGTGERTPAWIGEKCRSHDLAKQAMPPASLKVNSPPEPASIEPGKADATPSEKKRGLAWAPDIKAGAVGGIVTMALAAGLVPLGASIAAYALCGLVGGFLLVGGISRAMRAYAATEKQTQ